MERRLMVFTRNAERLMRGTKRAVLASMFACNFLVVVVFELLVVIICGWNDQVSKARVLKGEACEEGFRVDVLLLRPI